MSHPLRDADARRLLVERWVTAQRAAAKRRASAEGIPRRPAGSEVPLSLGQEQIYVHQRLAGNAPLYNEPFVVVPPHAADHAVLEQCLVEIVRRHDSLRTTYEWRGDRPVQVVGEAPPSVDVPFVDYGSLSPDDREAVTRSVAGELAQRAIDLATGPLLRAAHLRFAGEKDRLVLAIHQIAFDGTSVYNVLLPELAALYQAFSSGDTAPLDAPTVEYADFAHWQRTVRTPATLRGQLEYWSRTLQGLEPLTLPADHPRPAVPSYRGGQERFSLGDDLSRAVGAFARQEGATTFVTMLAALCVLLRRYTGETDFAVGTPCSTRSRPELARVFGNFINTLAIRANVSGTPGFRGIVGRLRMTVADALSNNEVPPHWIARGTGLAHESGGPLYQVMLNVEPTDGRAVAGWTASAMAVGNAVTRVDLSLEIEESSSGLAGRFRYDADLFSPATIRALAAYFCRLLREALSAPDRNVLELPMLGGNSDRGRTETPVRAATSFATFERAAIEQSIAGRFEEQARRWPGEPAVLDAARRATYAELDAAANSIARGLLGVGRAGDRVALLLGHDARMVAGLLGALKAGRVYVPIDATHPPARIALILRDAGASAILASEANLELAGRLSGGELPVLNVDRLSNCPPRPLAAPPVMPDAPAYILYTSGSTGEPKGVVQNHRNVLHFIGSYTNNLKIARGDRLSLVSSYSVDAAVMDIFGAVLNGATLCPIDLRATGFAGLGEALHGQQISIYHSTPTVFRHVTSTLGSAMAPPSVRLVVLGGEEVVRQDVDAFKRVFGEACVLVNGLGPTESTVTLQHFVRHDTVVDRLSVPVGRPVEATEIELLGPNLERGQVYGEIGIRSEHVALGYWKRPDLDEAAFLPDPLHGKARTYRTGDMGRLLADGTLLFEGRRDQQVKVRGYRVEVGEVEAALAKAPGVREGVIVARGEPANRHLVAYVVGAAGPADEALVRRFLVEHLPNYMVPAAIVCLDALPMTPSGKLDRRSLPEPSRTVARAGRRQPGTNTEAAVRDIWCSLLRHDEFTLEDDFFALGGDSLMAVRLFGEIEKRLGSALPLAILLQAGTIERLAAHIDGSVDAARARAGSPLVTIQRGQDDRAPLFCVHPIGGEVLCYRELASGLGAHQPVYGLKVDPDEVATGTPRVEELAARYVAEIRARWPLAPYRIAGYSFGGVVAYEMARQLDDGRAVALLALIDSSLPCADRSSLDTAVRASLNTVARLPAWVRHDLRAVGLRENALLAWHKTRRAAMGIRAALRGGRLAPTLADLSDRELAAHFPASRVPLVRALSRAAVAYSPRPYGGCVTLFRARSQPLFSADDPEAMWRLLAARLEVFELPGRHRHLLEGESLASLSRRLAACLDAAHDPWAGARSTGASSAAHATVGGG